MAAFFEKWQRAKGVFAPSKTRRRPDRADLARQARRASPPMPPSNASTARCATAACDTVRWNEDYLGPAALNRAWTLVNDVRDAGNRARLAAAAAATAAATPATRTRAASSTAPRRSTPPPPSPASSGARCRPTSGVSCDRYVSRATPWSSALPACGARDGQGRWQNAAVAEPSPYPLTHSAPGGTGKSARRLRVHAHERAALRPAAGDGGDHGAAGAGASRRHLLRHQPRPHRRRYPGTHARQRRLGPVLRAVRAGGGHARRHRRAGRGVRMAGPQGPVGRAS